MTIATINHLSNKTVKSFTEDTPEQIEKVIVEV